MKCAFPHLEQHQRDSTQVDWWHPTRLRLGGPVPDECKESKRIRFDVVTRLGSLHGNWTEFGWWFHSK
jgi:hypothetical protein